MRRSVTSVVFTLGLLLGLAGTAFAGQPVKTTIWLDGEMVRTILPPAASPQDGTDPFYLHGAGHRWRGGRGTRRRRLPRRSLEGLPRVVERSDVRADL